MSTIRVVNIQHSDATEPNIVLNADGTATFVSGITISGGTNLTVSGTAEFASGTVSAPGITFIDDNNTGIYEPAADTVAITTAATERLRVDSSGRVGIGESSPAANLEITPGTGAGTLLLNNASGSMTDGALNIEVGSGGVLYETRKTGGLAHIWYTTAAERMRIDTSGRLLVGTSSSSSVLTNTVELHAAGTGIAQPAYLTYSFPGAAPGSETNCGYLQFYKSRGSSVGTNTIVANDDRLGMVRWLGANGTDYDSAAEIFAEVDGTPGASGDMPGRLAFATTSEGSVSPTERMRITGQGFIKASNTGSYVTATQGTAATQHEITNSIGARDIMQLYHTNASSPYGIFLRFQNGAPNNGTNYFLYCIDSAAQRLALNSNGGIANYQSNNVNLCDEREKKNIETLDSTWGCLKNWELKKFHYNEDADTDDKRYGVIAQQVAPHCPEVITDWVKQKAEDAVLDEDGNVVTPAVEEVTRMGVKEQQMMWMAIKALQEAQARIETLEAKVNALEGN